MREYVAHRSDVRSTMKWVMRALSRMECTTMSESVRIATREGSVSSTTSFDLIWGTKIGKSGEPEATYASFRVRTTFLSREVEQGDSRYTDCIAWLESGEADKDGPTSHKIAPPKSGEKGAKLRVGESYVHTSESLAKLLRKLAKELGQTVPGAGKAKKDKPAVTVATAANSPVIS